MKSNIGMISLSIFIVLLFSFPTLSGQQQEFKGRMVGINCFMHNMDCSSEMYLYEHLQFEQDFVLLVGKDKHYMLPNLPRDVKIKTAGETVTIVGDTEKHGFAIDVENVQVNGKVVWSKELQRKALINQSRKFGGN